MQIAAFSVQDVQTFLMFLALAEGEGVTDIRFIRQRLEDRVAAARLAARVSRPDKNSAPLRAKPLGRCPDCGTPMVTLVEDGLTINACKACRLSLIVPGEELA